MFYYYLMQWIWLLPLLVGAILAAWNAESTNNFTEKIEAWIKRSQQALSTKDGWVNAYVFHPLFWMFVRFADWTDSMTHRGLKNGFRVAVGLYLIVAWAYILYVAFMIAVMIVLIGLALYIAYKVLLQPNNDDDSNERVERRRVVGYPPGKGKRVNPETGVIQEQSFLGWNDTNERIDPETGNIQERGFLGWNDSETRINQETGNIQERGFLGWNDSETRINPDSGVIQEKGMLGWMDTEVRIDPETGKRQKKGLLGWADE